VASTIHDVAAEAGVSIATVSRVIAGNYPVAKKTRERVEAAVERLNYSANPNAQRLRGVDIAPVAVLLGSITRPATAAASASSARREALPSASWSLSSSCVDRASRR
jgi:LacI family transcriptional regulator